MCDWGCWVILLPRPALVSGAGQVIVSEALNSMSNEKGEGVRGGLVSGRKVTEGRQVRRFTLDVNH